MGSHSKIHPFVVVDVTNSDPDQALDRIVLVDESGDPIQLSAENQSLVHVWDGDTFVPMVGARFFVGDADTPDPDDFNPDAGDIWFERGSAGIAIADIAGLQEYLEANGGGGGGDGAALAVPVTVRDATAQVTTAALAGTVYLIVGNQQNRVAVDVTLSSSGAAQPGLVDLDPAKDLPAGKVKRYRVQALLWGPDAVRSTNNGLALGLYPMVAAGKMRTPDAVLDVSQIIHSGPVVGADILVESDWFELPGPGIYCAGVVMAGQPAANLAVTGRIQRKFIDDPGA